MWNVVENITREASPTPRDHEKEMRNNLALEMGRDASSGDSGIFMIIFDFEIIKKVFSHRGYEISIRKLYFDLQIFQKGSPFYASFCSQPTPIQNFMTCLIPHNIFNWIQLNCIIIHFFSSLKVLHVHG